MQAINENLKVRCKRNIFIDLRKNECLFISTHPILQEKTEGHQNTPLDDVCQPDAKSQSTVNATSDKVIVFFPLFILKMLP